MKTLQIGIIGLGNVGSGLIQIIQEQAESLSQKTGLKIEISKICSRKDRRKEFSGYAFTTDWKEISQDPNIDLVCELIGGTTEAWEIWKSCFENNKTLVTANKALLSERWDETFHLAKSKNLEIGIEASVCGAIPIIRTIKTSLVGDSMEGIWGILNGTTNFILSRMETLKESYSESLKIAQDLGFAEQDPTLDVEGIDAAHKISILSTLAFQEKVSHTSIPTRGITQIELKDIQNAHDLGFRIKLLAFAHQTNTGLSVQVEPVLIPLEHPLAHIMNEKNCILYKTKNAGIGLISGKGAGGIPTASSVLADVLFYGQRRVSGLIQTEKNHFEEAKLSHKGDQMIRAYFRFTTLNKAGVLSEIANTFGKKGISIAYVRQEDSSPSDQAEVILLTHEAKEKSIQESIQEFSIRKDLVSKIPTYLRLMDHLPS
jgi:homoserine dehydrogenase